PSLANPLLPLGRELSITSIVLERRRLSLCEFRRRHGPGQIGEARKRGWCSRRRVDKLEKRDRHVVASRRGNRSLGPRARSRRWSLAENKGRKPRRNARISRYEPPFMSRVLFDMMRTRGQVQEVVSKGFCILVGGNLNVHILVEDHSGLAPVLHAHQVDRAASVNHTA